VARSSGAGRESESGSQIIEQDYHTWIWTTAAQRASGDTPNHTEAQRLQSAWEAIRARGLADHAAKHAIRLRATARANATMRDASHKTGQRTQARSPHGTDGPHHGLPPQVAGITQRAHSEHVAPTSHNGHSPTDHINIHQPAPSAARLRPSRAASQMLQPRER
jgi:hypothetical protein